MKVSSLLILLSISSFCYAHKADSLPPYFVPVDSVTIAKGKYDAMLKAVSLVLNYDTSFALNELSLIQEEAIQSNLSFDSLNIQYKKLNTSFKEYEIKYQKEIKTLSYNLNKAITENEELQEDNDDLKKQAKGRNRLDKIKKRLQVTGIVVVAFLIGMLSV